MEFAGKKYRIKSNFRFIIFIAISLVLLVMISNLFLGLGNVSGLTQKEFIEVTVSYGDTLWDLASTYMPDNIDPRTAVDTICDLNDVNATTLRAGQVLLIPIN